MKNYAGFILIRNVVHQYSKLIAFLSFVYRKGILFLFLFICSHPKEYSKSSFKSINYYYNRNIIIYYSRSNVSYRRNYANISVFKAPNYTNVLQNNAS
jgi:hypothetical protein